MKKELEQTVIAVAKKAASAANADEAMKYAQAALNASNALRVLMDYKE